MVTTEMATETVMGMVTGTAMAMVMATDRITNVLIYLS